jgi:hypothetical protein
MARESYRLARETYTPIEFFVSLAIPEFFYWRDNVMAAMKEDARNKPKVPRIRRR